MSDILSDNYRSAHGTGAAPFLSRAAGAAVFLLLVAGMSVWAYRLGTRDATEVPIIRALEGPARVQPAEPGGLQAAHQGLEVNEVLGGAPVPSPAEAAASPPPPPPVTLAEEDGPQGELVVPAPDFAALAEPAEGEELRMPPQDDGPLPGEVALAAAPEPAPADLASVVPGLVAEALAEAGAEPPAAAPPGPRPRVRPAGGLTRAAAAPTPARPAEPVVVAAAAPAPPAEVSRLNAGTRLVQLGAFDNEALARQVWGQLVQRNGDLLGGKSLYLERATTNARVFYRLRVAGFQNPEETRLLCEALRGRGVDCIPVTLQ